MAAIEFFKASVKDKKPTIRVSQLRGYFYFPKLNPGDEVILSTIKYGIITFKASRFDSITQDCTTIYGTEVWSNTLPKIDVGMKTYIDVKGIVVDKNPQDKKQQKVLVVGESKKVPLPIINKVLNKKLLMLQIETGEGPEVTEVTRKQINDMFPGDLEINEPTTIKLIEMTQAKSDECCVRGEIVGGEMYPKRMVIGRLKEEIKELEEKRKAIDEEILALNIRIENIRKMKV